MGETPWTLEELSERVKLALEALGLVHQRNGQVSEVPNGRTIRYYATIGVIDRPRLVGRTAMYGQRHLEQIVAIKRMQAAGLPLSEVHRRLVALDDEGLRTLAALPAEVADPVAHPAVKQASRRDQAFRGNDVEDPAIADPRALAIERKTPTAMQIAGITLPEGVTLCFPAAGTVDEDDRESLRAALKPVLKILRARGLLKSRTGERP